MLTIGLLGGMSWESTALYYRLVNEAVKERLGGLHSARIAMLSVDFHQVEILQHAGRWEEAGALLADAARRIEAAGADFLLICTNTMHKVAPCIEAAISIPLLHIADPTAAAARAAGYGRVGLLGTAFTMEQEFYVGRLRQRHGLEVLVPDAGERAEVHRIIFEELCLGRVLDGSRDLYAATVERLAARGAEAVILGCTEITLLIGPDDTAVPLLDTTALHARAAVERAVAGTEAGT